MTQTFWTEHWTSLWLSTPPASEQRDAGNDSRLLSGDFFCDVYDPLSQPEARVQGKHKAPSLGSSLISSYKCDAWKGDRDFPEMLKMMQRLHKQDKHKNTFLIKWCMYITLTSLFQNISTSSSYWRTERCNLHVSKCSNCSKEQVEMFNFLQPHNQGSTIRTFASIYLSTLMNWSQTSWPSISITPH